MNPSKEDWEKAREKCGTNPLKWILLFIFYFAGKTNVDDIHEKHPKWFKKEEDKQ